MIRVCSGHGYTPGVRRGLTFSLLVACAAAGVLSAVLLAATPSATADRDDDDDRHDDDAPTAPADHDHPDDRRPTTPPPTTTPPTIPRPTTIAAGVTVGGEVLVGGLSPAEATAVVKTYFARPLELRLGKVTLRVTPKQLGASAYVGDAIKRARIVAPGANVPLKVAAPTAAPRALRDARSAKRFDRAAVDSRAAASATRSRS